MTETHRGEWEREQRWPKLANESKIETTIYVIYTMLETNCYHHGLSMYDLTKPENQSWMVY
jgi:hypothetical protein